MNRGILECHTIDFGPSEKTSGTGLYLRIDDIEGMRWKDILAPGKEGLYLFRNFERVR